MTVRAWVGGAEQPVQATAPNSMGEQQAMWTLYRTRGPVGRWSCSRSCRRGWTRPRWEIVALGGTTTTVGRCEQRVLYFQLIDKGEPGPRLPSRWRRRRCYRIRGRGSVAARANARRGAERAPPCRGNP
jgi:hypothetical protein